MIESKHTVEMRIDERDPQQAQAVAKFLGALTEMTRAGVIQLPPPEPLNMTDDEVREALHQRGEWGREHLRRAQAFEAELTTLRTAAQACVAAWDYGDITPAIESMRKLLGGK